MPKLSFAEAMALPKAEFDRLYRDMEPGKIEVLPAPRTLGPFEMAAFITATVEFWKFRVQRDGPFGADFPKIDDVARDLYAAIIDFPAAESAPIAVTHSDSDSLAPVVLAAALNATTEIWKLSFEQQFAGYRASINTRAPIEVIAKQVRAVIEILAKPIAA